MPSARALLAVATLTAAASAPAAADAQWSLRETVSREHSFISPMGIGYTANGFAVASWAWQDGLGNEAVAGVSMVSGAAFPGPERVLPAGVVSSPAPSGSNRVIIARLADRDRGRDTLRVQFGDTNGRFGTARIVARRSGIRRAQLAANLRGDAALCWFEDRGTSNDRVYVSVRRAGGSFGRPRRLAQERIRNVSVAVGPAGEILVAWDARGTIRTRFKGRSARSFAGPDTLRSEPTFFAALQTGVDAGGTAWVAWTAQFLSEGGDRGEAFVQAALRSPGGRRFHRALLLARGTSTATATPVSLALDGHGAATLAWMMWERDTTAVHAARVSAAGTPDVQEVTRFAAVEPLGTAIAAADSGGNALVVWTRLVDASNRTELHASVQPPSGRWGPPELVSGGYQAVAPVAAYPPLGGPPSVLFANRPARELNRTVAQVATRTG